MTMTMALGRSAVTPCPPRRTSGRTRTSSMTRYAWLPSVGTLIRRVRAQLPGTDILIGADLVQRHFPFLDRSIEAAVHVRRCGWLSAQQAGAVMLEQMRVAEGDHFELVRAAVSGVAVRDGAASGVVLDDGRELSAGKVVLAPGPLLPSLLASCGTPLGMSRPAYFAAACLSRRRRSAGV